MFQQVQNQVQGRADLLLAGRYEDMCRDYVFPLPVYLENHMMALHDVAAGIERAASLRRILHRRQIATLTITVRALELPRDGRFRVWADWQAVSCSDHRSRRLALIYYMRETRHGYRSEMLHYQRRHRRDNQRMIEARQHRA